jgi:hypothetical protein
MANMSTTKFNLGLLFCGLAFLACNTEKTGDVRWVQKKTERELPKLTPSSPVKKEFEWITPENWIEHPTSGLRLGSFIIPEVPNTSGGTAEVFIIKLLGEGGGRISNVNRWREEVGLPSLSENEMGKLINRDAGRLGDFEWFEMVNPSAPKIAILAAIIPYQNATLFVKGIGSPTLLKQHKDAFLRVCRSIQPAKVVE